MKRSQALVGFLMFRVARRIALRRMDRAMDAPRRGRHSGGSKMKTVSTRAAADRAAALVEVVRPIVTKAMNDPELHDALRQAFVTSTEVKDKVSGRPPTEAARKIAKDRKLQKRVETSAQDLQKAVSNLVEQPPKKRKRRVLGRLVVVGAIAGGVVVALKKVRRGGDDVPY
jgi:hypothetical protein